MKSTSHIPQCYHDYTKRTFHLLYSAQRSHCSREFVSPNQQLSWSKPDGRHYLLPHHNVDQTIYLDV